jgi:hypothetical protein
MIQQLHYCPNDDPKVPRLIILETVSIVREARVVVQRITTTTIPVTKAEVVEEGTTSWIKRYPMIIINVVPPNLAVWMMMHCGVL